MIGPGEDKLLVFHITHALLAGHHHRHLLAGMGDRLHIDHGHIGIGRERVEDFVFAVVVPIEKFRECPHPNHIAVRRQDPRCLLHMLFSLAIHDDPVFKL